MKFKGNLSQSNAMQCIRSWRIDSNNRGYLPNSIVVHPSSYVFLRDDIRRNDPYSGSDNKVRVMGIPVMATYEIEENEILIGNLL